MVDFVLDQEVVVVFRNSKLEPIPATIRAIDNNLVRPYLVYFNVGDEGKLATAPEWLRMRLARNHGLWFAWMRGTDLEPKVFEDGLDNWV